MSTLKENLATWGGTGVGAVPGAWAIKAGDLGEARKMSDLFKIDVAVMFLISVGYFFG